MRISTLGYTAKQGLRNIRTNKIFSIASIATMSACIFLFGLFVAIVINFRSIVNEAETGVAITVFFDEGISEEKIEEIGTLLREREEVDRINLITADEALEKFIDEYYAGQEELAEIFKEDNPLEDSASYEVYLRDIQKQKELVQYLETVEGIRQINQSEVVAETLSDVNVLLGYISISIILILLFVSIFLISNMVTIGITVRKEEIGIMKLIGASDFMVRAPFLLEGIVVGLIGSIIPLVILFFVYNNVVEYITVKFQILNGVLQFLPVWEVFQILIPAALVLGIGIGFIGSRLTIRKHLKV